MDKKKYEPPRLEVTLVETECNIAESGNYRVVLQDWQQDTTPDAPYDGDIWLNL